MSFDKEGHRGCRGLMPENTIPAMLKAIDLHVTTLEMDAVITKDQQVVLSHEPFFNHEISTKPNGSMVTEDEEKSLNIFQMTYDQVKAFDVGLKPHPRFPRQEKIPAFKPLLSMVIDSVEAYSLQHGYPPLYYNIETKTQPITDNIYHPPPVEFVDNLVRVIMSKAIEQRVIIQSFDFRTLQYLHSAYPVFKTAMLIEADDIRSFEQQLDDLGFTPTIYSPDFSLVSQELVEKCHRLSISVIPWTVNDSQKIEALKELGVDGIITDYPDILK